MRKWRDLSPGMGTHMGADKQRRLHQGPGSEMGFCFFVSQRAITTIDRHEATIKLWFSMTYTSSYQDMSA